MRRRLVGLAAACSLAGFAALGAGAAPALAQTDVAYAADATPFGSAIGILGEPDVDLIDVSVAGNTITITDLGPGGITTSSAECAAVGPTVTCPLNPPGGGAPVGLMLSLLEGGNDSYANTSLPTVDSIAPEGGDDTVQTGPRRDEMGADAGNDTFDSGEGDDSIINGPGADLMNGGPGVDRTDYEDSNAGVDVTLDDQANDGAPGEGDNAAQIEQVAGTRFDDSLTGNGVANELEGDEGDDQLTGLGGNDELFGDEGDDILNPGASPDGSRDFVFCGSGFDVALVDPLDAIDPSCERRGVRITGESATVKRKGMAKVLVACPLDARDPCAGTLILLSDGKRITKTGSFDLPAGGTANARVKLTGKGKKALRKADGKLLVTAQAQTVETGGVATTEAQVLLTGRKK